MTTGEILLANSTVTNVAVSVHLQNLSGGGIDRVIIGVKAKIENKKLSANLATTINKAVFQKGAMKAKVAHQNKAILSPVKLKAKGS